MRVDTRHVGMLADGAYSIGWAGVDLVREAWLELGADLGQMMFGRSLGLSAAVVRARVPGGLALAVGALLGLQAVALHNAAHLESSVTLQVGRAVLGMALASVGRQRPRERPSTRKTAGSGSAPASKPDAT
jgi:hypothetical protein